MDGDPAEALRASLLRHPPERQPLQHATAQFHLGGVLLGRGAVDEAEAAFTAAAALFGARGARPEQAKALNGLGAALRVAGRLELAARALEHASAGLAAAGLALEEGAAMFNLGLVLRESDRASAAAAALARAAELLDPAQVPGQAAAAMRELGVTRLGLGELDAAEAALTAAMHLADRARDAEALGAVANTLGLALLAGERPADAAQAFATAAAANPRGVRPEAFAMAKANLALARERSGTPAQARLAARQALAIGTAAPPVRAQAAAVLERLGTTTSDLRVALAEAPDDEARARLVREELLRSAGASEPERATDMLQWIDAHTEADSDPAEVAEVWLGGALELPPDALATLARTAVAAAMSVDAAARDTFRTAVTRAMARFHVPQMMRLQDVFAVAAADVGDPTEWR